MGSTNAVFQFVAMLVPQAAMLVVYLLGAFLAIRWWRRYPRPAMLVLLGVSILLATSLATTAIQVYVVRTVAPGGGGAASISSIFQIVGLVAGVVRAGGTALLIAAAFAERRTVDVGFPVEMGGAAPRPVTR